jgi:methyltransferase (TIGR00027 family)
MALFRALESSRSPDSRLFCDPFAPLFLYQWPKLFHALAQFDVGRKFVEQLLYRNAPDARAAGIARTKWIDDEVTQALEIATQLVLLGAGFDTRAYRLLSAQRVISFELDHPETSRVKQAVLHQEIAKSSKHVRFVPIDFNRQSLSEVLAQPDFDTRRPACFVWEGVTNYLTAEAVDGVLRQIAQAAPGSVLLFTYIHRDAMDRPETFFGAKKLKSKLQSYGEPWTFGLDPEEVKEYLAARGLRLIKDFSVAEIWQRAGRSNSGTRGYEFYRLALCAMQRGIVAFFRSVSEERDDSDGEKETTRK